MYNKLIFLLINRKINYLLWNNINVNKYKIEEQNEI